MDVVLAWEIFFKISNYVLKLTSQYIFLTGKTQTILSMFGGVCDDVTNEWSFYVFHLTFDIKHSSKGFEPFSFGYMS